MAGSPYTPHDIPREQIMSDALEAFEHDWTHVRAAMRERRNDQEWSAEYRAAYASCMYDGDRFIKRLQDLSRAL
jgi:hypothetical protein